MEDEIEEMEEEEKEMEEKVREEEEANRKRRRQSWYSLFYIYPLSFFLQAEKEYKQ